MIRLTYYDCKHNVRITRLYWPDGTWLYTRID